MIEVIAAVAGASISVAAMGAMLLFIPFVITPLLCWIFIPVFVRLKVSSGYECGIGLENYNDIKVGDIIEAFEMEEFKTSL